MICSHAASDRGKMDLAYPAPYDLKFVTIVPMTVPHNIVKLAGAGAAFCAYFTAAFWLQASFTPDRNFVFGPDAPGEKIRLVPPFTRLNESNFAVAVEKYKLFDELADSDDNNVRSIQSPSASLIVLTAWPTWRRNHPRPERRIPTFALVSGPISGKPRDSGRRTDNP